MVKGREVFIAKNATVIGNVELGANSSVWFGAVIRGDGDKIKIGERTNVQDLSIIHVDPGVPVTIGNEVIIGHASIVHGASIGDNTLIGMRSTIMNHAKIGKYCVIGAHALVTEGMEIPDYSVVMGSPAKIVKTIREEDREKLRLNALHYVELAKKYLSGEFSNK
jgi:carbonic anhydrase/acetyltransferase-like protein (isoleucine patch superfamily)